VLLERVKQDDQVRRPLVEHAISRVGEPHPQLAQLAVDL
jgi:hypothetical protein